MENNLGEQPISRIIVASGLKPHDLVAHSDEQLTHKMVTRAMKGVFLVPFRNLVLQVSLFLRLKVSPDDTSQ